MGEGGREGRESEGGRGGKNGGGEKVVAKQGKRQRDGETQSFLPARTRSETSRRNLANFRNRPKSLERCSLKSSPERTLRNPQTRIAAAGRGLCALPDSEARGPLRRGRGEPLRSGVNSRVRGGAGSRLRRGVGSRRSGSRLRSGVVLRRFACPLALSGLLDPRPLPAGRHSWRAALRLLPVIY